MAKPRGMTGSWCLRQELGLAGLVLKVAVAGAPATVVSAAWFSHALPGPPPPPPPPLACAPHAFGYSVRTVIWSMACPHRLASLTLLAWAQFNRRAILQLFLRCRVMLIPSWRRPVHLTAPWLSFHKLACVRCGPDLRTLTTQDGPHRAGAVCRIFVFTSTVSY